MTEKSRLSWVFGSRRGVGVIMKTRFALSLTSVVLGLYGCASPAPVAENFPVSYQKVARTAQHWEVVANDIVAQTVVSIEANPVLQKRPVFVPRAYGATTFDYSFRDFLINHMVNRGVPVNVCKSTPSSKPGFDMEGREVEIQYEARIISHHATIPKYRPGVLTALGAGVAVVYDMATHAPIGNETGIAAALGIGAAADAIAGSWTSPTNTELVVTTTIAENNRFIFRRSDIYYVPDADASLFFKRVSQRSICPEENKLVSDGQSNTLVADVEASRREMFIRDMRRSNPNYVYEEGWELRLQR